MITPDKGNHSVKNTRKYEKLYESRERNEVLCKHGSQLESLWIGHSEKVMEDHYFDLEDEDFLQAVGE